MTIVKVMKNLVWTVEVHDGQLSVDGGGDGQLSESGRNASEGQFSESRKNDGLLNG